MSRALLLVLAGLSVSGCDQYDVCEIRETRTLYGYTLAADTLRIARTPFQPGYVYVQGSPYGQPVKLEVYRVVERKDCPASPAPSRREEQ